MTSLTFAQIFSAHLEGLVIARATFFFNLSRNIAALQVETNCCAYYRVRDQLVLQQNIVLNVGRLIKDKERNSIVQ